MVNTEKALENFIANAKMVQTECIKTSKEDFKQILNEKKFDFIHLNTPFKTFNKDCQINEDGIDSAIVFGDLAIAETGTIVINSKNEQLRLGTMLAENLSVVIYNSNIVSKLENVVSFMNEKNSEDSTYIAFITGPSRTADIERVLTIGVHGPVSLTCYILEDL